MSDVCNIEFLDLSDVDENEQIRLRESLQRNDPSVQLPWVKSGKKVASEGIKQLNREVKENDVKNTPNQEYIHPMISPVPHLNPEFRQSPVIVSPMVPGHYQSNPLLFASTLSPVSPPYPQQIYAIPQNTINNVIHSYPNTTYPYSQPITYPYPVTTQQVHLHNNVATDAGYASPHMPNAMLINNAQVTPLTMAIPQQNFGNGTTLQKEPVGLASPDTEEEYPLDEWSHAMPVEDENLFEISIQPPTPPLVHNGAEKRPEQETVPATSAGKSWASLFNPSKSTNGVSSHNNETSEKSVDKVVNNENVCPIKHPRRSQFVDPDCYRMGEFLTEYSVDGRAVSLQPRGLINQSNYCYINSILQALIACPPFYNLMTGLAQNISSNEKRKPTPVVDGMCRFVKWFKHLPANLRVNNRRSDGKNPKKDQGIMINTDVPFEPAWIYKMLNGIRTDLIEGRQEDAEEFLGCMLNGLNDEMLELIKLVKNDCDAGAHPAKNLDREIDAEKEWQVMGPKNKGSVTRRTDFGRTPISDIFGGFLKSRIHRAGDHVTENIQPFFTLQLNIEKVKTVREALEALVTKYQLEGLTSSKTNEEVEAWQQVMLDELPIVLVLHLKCFDFKLDGCTKIIKALEFPIDLKIDSKLLSSKTHQTQKEKQYKLFAVVYHDGKEATKGHYITDTFHVGYSSWLRYDDASVKPVQEEHVLKPQGTRVPYLLFYRRSDTIRSK